MSAVSQDLTVGFVLGLFFFVLPIASVWVRRSLRLRLLKHVFPLEPEGSGQVKIHVRASLDEIEFGRNPATMRGYTHCCDVHAVTLVHQTFEHLPAEVEFDYFPEIGTDMKNILIIGCSSRSSVSNELGRELKRRHIRVSGNKQHAYFRTPSGIEYHCEHAEVANRTIVAKDAAVIMRRKTEGGKTILLCGGLHTQGSLAALEVALLPEFQKRVRGRKLKQFIQFVTVDGIVEGPKAGLGILRQSIAWKNLPLVDLDDGQ